MEMKIVAFAICYSCVSSLLLLPVGGENINSAEKTTVKSAEPTTTSKATNLFTTQAPQVQIKCLGNDCNSGPTTKVASAPARGGLIAANTINDPKPVKQDPKPLSSVEDVTSVPRKGVGVVDEGPSVPRKGVTSDHHAQSAKKELKDLSVQTGDTSTTTTTTTSTTSRTPPTTTMTTINDAFINRNKTSNLNSVVTTTTTSSAEKSRSKPDVTVDEQDYVTSKATDPGQSTMGTSLVVGLVCALVLMTVLLFVGLKRIESIRRRREYRRMNDFLIDGMYNDL